MTKTLKLHSNTLGFYCDSTRNWKPVCCIRFLQKELNVPNPPDIITLIASTDPLENSTSVKFIKNGFYRWHCETPNATYSCPIYVEDELNSIFPEAREDGLDEGHTLFIKIQCPK